MSAERHGTVTDDLGKLSDTPRQSTGSAQWRPSTSTPGLKAVGTVIAFDFGTKRVGVAVGDMALGIAHALNGISFEDNRRRFEAIAALVEEWHPARLVVGCPGGGDETDHPLAAQIKRFSRRLHTRIALPVDLVDEHLSSWTASGRLTQAGVPARAQKLKLDSMAACAILETWFEIRRANIDLTQEGQ